MTTLYAHEHVIVANGGLRNERINYTGDHEFFRTKTEALVSARSLNKAYDLGLTVYEISTAEAYR